MTITNEKLIALLGAAAILGISGTVSYARKAVKYRKELIKAINATNTVTHLLFKAKELIHDPDELERFEMEIEYHVKNIGDLNRAL